jgi:hypothetical protein
VQGLDQKLAALFGTTIDKIAINDMVVHQPREQIFISVERGHGTDAIPAIVKVNHGQLEILELDGIPHSQVSIPNEPIPRPCWSLTLSGCMQSRMSNTITAKYL